MKRFTLIVVLKSPGLCDECLQKDTCKDAYLSAFVREEETMLQAKLAFNEAKEALDPKMIMMVDNTNSCVYLIMGDEKQTVDEICFYAQTAYLYHHDENLAIEKVVDVRKQDFIDNMEDFDETVYTVMFQNPALLN